MNQIGKVVEVFKDNRAKILMTKHAACGDCGACQHGQENMKLNIIANNEMNAKIGDMVEVNMETENVLGAAFIMYVIPLLMMVISIGVSNYLLKKLAFDGNVEIFAVMIGFIITGVTYGVIKLFEGTFKKNRKYVPMISKILTK